MNDSTSSRPIQESDALTGPPSPLVFISHDTRDAELAEAFSKLLKKQALNGKTTINFGCRLPFH